MLNPRNVHGLLENDVPVGSGKVGEGERKEGISEICQRRERDGSENLVDLVRAGPVPLARDYSKEQQEQSPLAY